MIMPTNFARVQEFHNSFDPQPLPLEHLLPRRLSFLLEEVREVTEASEALAAAPQNKQAKAHLVKELVDVLYITYGTLELLRVDADAAFAEVHRSNMSKTPNPHGKAIKGEAYQPAQMEQFV